MLFIPVGPLPQLLRYTRYSLFFQRFQPQHPAHKTHKLLLFRLASAHGAAPEFYSMESKCPHLGADLGKAGASRPRGEPAGQAERGMAGGAEREELWG